MGEHKINSVECRQLTSTDRSVQAGGSRSTQEYMYASSIHTHCDSHKGSIHVQGALDISTLCIPSL